MPPLSAIERIEVIRGRCRHSNGFGRKWAVVVNIITKKVGTELGQLRDGGSILSQEDSDYGATKQCSPLHQWAFDRRYSGWPVGFGSPVMTAKSPT